jgi:hypothetical protein
VEVHIQPILPCKEEVRETLKEQVHRARRFYRQVRLGRSLEHVVELRLSVYK